MISIESLNRWADQFKSTALHSAWATIGDGSVYTITREIAGGPFTPRINGVAIRPAGRLRDARHACVRHNGGPLEWVNESQRRANA